MTLAERVHQLLLREARVPQFSMIVRRSHPVADPASNVWTYSVANWKPGRDVRAETESGFECEFGGDNLAIGRDLMHRVPPNELRDAIAQLRGAWRLPKVGEDLTGAIALAFQLLWEEAGPGAACAQALSNWPATPGFVGFAHIMYRRVRYCTSEFPDAAVDHLYGGANTVLGHLGSSSRGDGWAANPQLREAATTLCRAIRDMTQHCAVWRAADPTRSVPSPALREDSVRSLPSLVRGTSSVVGAPATADRGYDVFISHAAEDKDAVVRPLANALVARGLRVWYDEFELRIGDSLRRSIDRGLASSRFGVVVLSPSFFVKGWPQYELDGLVTRETTGEQVILPVWHEIKKAEVTKYSPSLADKLARSTATHTVEEIAAEILAVVRGTGATG